jgi:hypothetical protein
MLGADVYLQVDCIVDGLDIYQDGMDDLIETLARIFSSAAGGILKLSCTGRPNPTILKAWERSPRRILRCNHNDLDAFIQRRVASLTELEGYNREMKNMMLGGEVCPIRPSARWA